MASIEKNYSSGLETMTQLLGDVQASDLDVVYLTG
jgi:hypothetical protein